MIKSCATFLGVVALAAIHFPWTPAGQTPLPQGSMLTLMGTYMLSSIVLNLECILNHSCNIDAAKDVVILLRDTLLPICDKDKQPDELISIVLQAGLRVRREEATLDPTCTIGGVDVSGTSTSAISTPSVKCKIDRDLRTIINNFADMHPLVDCQRPEFKIEAQKIIIYNLKWAVCKKYGYPVYDFAKASTYIVERMRDLDYRQCYNESMDSVCDNLGEL